MLLTLKCISNQWILDVSIISGKPEAHPKISQWCNPLDSKFYLSKLTNKISPYSVLLILGVVHCSENRLKINITPYG